MSNGMPDSEQYKANNRDPDRPKRIRIIGGPTISPPPDVDFQQVPFTLEGLTKVDNLENADTIVYWPIKRLFTVEAIGEELFKIAGEVAKAPSGSTILGLNLENMLVPAEEPLLNLALEQGYVPYSKTLKIDQEGVTREFQPVLRMSPCQCEPYGLKFSVIKLQETIAIILTNEEHWVRKEWTDSLLDTHKDFAHNPINVFSLVLMDICTRSFSAAQKGSAIVVVAPNDFTIDYTIIKDRVEMQKCFLAFSFAFMWLCPSMLYFFQGNAPHKVNKSSWENASTHFIQSATAWSTQKTDPHINFAVDRASEDNKSKYTTRGVLRDNEIFTGLPMLRNIHVANGNDDLLEKLMQDFNRNRFNIQYCPLRHNEKDFAMDLVFRCGSGGFVVMSEPPSLESLLGIKTDENLFIRIEPTNRRIPIKGQQDDGYIVEATLSSGMKHDVPMTVVTFRRFLAFCVAAKLASPTNPSGTIDLTIMEIGKVDLSGVVDPVTQGQGHKPGQLIKDAFDERLPFKCDIIQSSPTREKDSRRLHPDLWNIVKFDALMKQVRKPRKSDTENEDALRKIFSVLK